MINQTMLGIIFVLLCVVIWLPVGILDSVDRVPGLLMDLQQ